MPSYAPALAYTYNILSMNGKLSRGGHTKVENKTKTARRDVTGTTPMLGAGGLAHGRSGNARTQTDSAGRNIDAARSRPSQGIFLQPLVPAREAVELGDYEPRLPLATKLGSLVQLRPIIASARFDLGEFGNGDR